MFSGRRIAFGLPPSSSMAKPADISGRSAMTASMDDLFAVQDDVTSKLLGAWPRHTAAA